MIRHYTSLYGPNYDNWPSPPDHYQIIDNVPDASDLFDPMVNLIREYSDLMVRTFSPLISQLEPFSSYPPIGIILLAVTGSTLYILRSQLWFLFENTRSIARRLYNIHRSIAEYSIVWHNHPNLREVFGRIRESIDPILEIVNRLANLIRNAVWFIENSRSYQDERNRQQQQSQQQPGEEQEEERPE